LEPTKIWREERRSMPSSWWFWWNGINVMSFLSYGLTHRSDQVNVSACGQINPSGLHLDSFIPPKSQILSGNVHWFVNGWTKLNW
jgi:hypothetical protein